MGETMFGLDALAQWEDLTLDRNENAIIVSQCTWTDKLMARNARINTIMELSYVRHVGVSVNMGLFFVCDDGKVVGLDTRGLTRAEIQNHRKLINYFINTSSNIDLIHHRLLNHRAVIHDHTLESVTLGDQKMPNEMQSRFWDST